MPNRSAAARALAGVAGLALLGAPDAVPLADDERVGPSVLAIEAVEVEPPVPPPATLCRLRVRLRNRGPETVSGFVFQVRIDGREVAASSRRLYLIDLEPGAVETIRLLNFWSSENGRRPPPSGLLGVEVRLTQAHQLSVDRDRRPPVRTFVGEVPGLPLARRIEVPIRR